MSADIPSQLRHEACHIETDETLEHVAKLMRSGADELDARQAEIERLRGELERTRKIARYWLDEHGRVEEERDALRARIAEADGQAPVAWMLPRDGHDCAVFREPGDFTRSGVATAGWTPIFARPIPTPAAGVPGAITVSMAPTSQYARGWNDCRDKMLAAKQPAPQAAGVPESNE